MATLKHGLDYFPLDVDFFENDKVQLVAGRFGLRGENIIIRLLCKIYGNSYFYRLSDDEIILFAQRIGDGCHPAFIKEVVREAAKRGIFDPDIYKQFRILTSEGIQKRYIEATGRRKEVILHEQLLLIDRPAMSNVNILSPNVYIITENGDIIRQSKGKEKEKEKENVENESEQAHICAHTRTHEEKVRKNDHAVIISDYEKFLKWMKKHAPYCAERKHFPKQITEKQFYKLKEKYSGNELAAIIEQIENRKDLRQKYTNLYRTVLNWAEKTYGN